MIQLVFFSDAEREMIHQSFVNYVRQQATSIKQLSDDTHVSRLALFRFIKQKNHSQDKTYAKIYTFLKNKRILL